METYVKPNPEIQSWAPSISILRQGSCQATVFFLSARANICMKTIIKYLVSLGKIRGRVIAHLQLSSYPFLPRENRTTFSAALPRGSRNSDSCWIVQKYPSVLPFYKMTVHILFIKAYNINSSIILFLEYFDQMSSNSRQILPPWYYLKIRFNGSHTVDASFGNDKREISD